jgi:ligand-binding sensor domain-containing protein
LWVGTAFDGLHRFKDGKFRTYGEIDGLTEPQIRVLFQSRSGELWVGTSNGLFRFNEGKFRPVVIDPNYIMSIAEDSLGRIWIGTHRGVRIFVSGHEIVEARLTSDNGLPSSLVTTIFPDREGNVWIGSYETLVRWTDGKITTITDLPASEITSIFEDRYRNLWVGSKRGLGRLSDGKWTTFTAADGLSHDFVQSVTEDHEGSLWVGTFEGLNRFNDVNITSYTARDGLGGDNLTGIIETPDGSMNFLSDSASSLSRLKNGVISNYTGHGGSAYVARDGSLWIAHNGTLTNFRDNTLKVYDIKDGVPNHWISAITEDDEGMILYLDDVGVRRFSGGQIKPYLLKNGQAYPDIHEEYVICFYHDSAGALWFGATNGLVRIKDGERSVFTKKDGMADNWVSSIVDDKRGSLWIGSARGCLTRFRNGLFTSYTSKSGLFTNEIYCVLSDQLGDLWLSSPQGIGHLTREDLDNFESGLTTSVHTHVYTTDDGMKTDECFGEWPVSQTYSACRRQHCESESGRAPVAKAGLPCRRRRQWP